MMINPEVEDYLNSLSGEQLTEQYFEDKKIRDYLQNGDHVVLERVIKDKDICFMLAANIYRDKYDLPIKKTLEPIKQQIEHIIDMIDYYTNNIYRTDKAWANCYVLEALIDLFEDRINPYSRRINRTISNLMLQVFKRSTSIAELENGLYKGEYASPKLTYDNQEMLENFFATSIFTTFEPDIEFRAI